jgi:tRNA uridine 5-carboxymethylaminomethyl modification enzyme
LGLATSERMDLYKQKEENIRRIIEFAEQQSVKPEEVNAMLESVGTAPLARGCKMIELLGRPQVTIAGLSEVLPQLNNLIESIDDRKEETVEEAEIQIKYSGYIERELEQAEKMHRLENIKIRGRFDYNSLQSISTEGRQKLIRHDPETLAQASRIPGVSPSDINVLLVLLGR